MDTASYELLFFGLIAAAASNVKNTPGWRSTVLLVSSFIFLVFLSHDLLGFLPLIAFLAFGYFSLVLLARGAHKLLGGMICVTVFAFIWLKQYTFLPHNMLLRFPYFTLGLSYIFFRVLHLVIEAGQCREKLHVGPLQYLMYTLNFTTFISGPIQPYDDFARNQFVDTPLPLSGATIRRQLERIVRGFFKVTIVALVLNVVREDAVSQLLLQGAPRVSAVLAAIRLVLVYPFFLYANFSGYIDIVIALARLMRLDLPENFDRPFSADSFLELWNRWHITLSNWLKTYVYNPLLVFLMRRFSSERWQSAIGVVCYFITFFLIGIWHNRTSEFAFYGVLLGVGVSVNKIWQLGLARFLGRKRYKTLAGENVYIALGRGLTFCWFAFSLLWFWATWAQLGRLGAALGFRWWLVVWIAAWLGIAFSLAVWEAVRSRALALEWEDGPMVTHPYTRVICATAMIVVTVAVTIFLDQPSPGLVYKAF